MPWIYAIVGLVIGIVIGVLFGRFTTPEYKKQKTVQKDLDATKFALEQQKQELTDYFAQSAEMLDTLGKDYTKLYQHMAKTSAELLPNQPEQDNPFVKQITLQTEDNTTSGETETDQPPKDYAKGATGLFTDAEKEIIHSKEVLTAKAS
ncbi:Z-ring associated protein ZapG [Vibrio sp. YMD68]|uniref:Z-ring associated protein ZapG n=1 Tax=Vibrio sp. YMD68 TaxID=3042300 RepID=UPI00249B3AE7|nr:Z-ring associated protein ZapG [Vibrio sp. YMD68]WGW00801.1 Z-ring associated protein ZapG [Vibrio sp. YMD68]